MYFTQFMRLPSVVQHALRDRRFARINMRDNADVPQTTQRG
jgi:hypothetical protein